MYTLKIKNLSKSFKGVQILKNINIEIETGMFLVLLGPSGCGKSTLLNAIAGLEPPTSGEIILGDRILNDVKPKDRDIAMVFQSYALYPNFNVYNNIAFGLKIRKTPKPERERIIQDLTKMLRINKHLYKKPSLLSGGERQRVAIARALARNPKLFLFDEPLSNLDAKLRQQMRSEIKKIHKNIKTTCIYVTHDQVEAMTMGNIIAILNQGDIQQIGPPSQIYQDPQNMFVAGFIGSPPMNFIEAKTVVRGGGNLELEVLEENKKVLLSMPGGIKNVKKDQKVILGIRPSNITKKENPKDKSNIIRCKLELIEPTGSDTYLTAFINNTKVISRINSYYMQSDEEIIDLHFDMPKAILFDPTTEQRIR